VEKESEAVVTDFCSDCPDYEMCWGAGDWRIIRHACPTRCRELEALAEVERLKVERDNWKAAYDREAIDRKDCLAGQSKNVLVGKNGSTHDSEHKCR